MNRRNFLKAAGTFSAAASGPFLGRILGANERITIGQIGLGARGYYELTLCLRNPQVEIAAVCDVFQPLVDHAVGKVGGRVQGCTDFRRVLDRKDIDAVFVSTPDHWHAPISIMACQAGKDVYCEKPLTLTVVEGRKMVEAARANRRIVQTGSQQRSDPKFRLTCELVRSGRIGKVQKVIVGLPRVNFAGPPVPDSDPPPELDYDLWLGPAPKRPYNAKRVHYLFRFFWDYSGGQMTNFGAHDIDIAQWGLDMDESGPVAVEGTATFHPEKWYETPSTCRLTYTYANGATMLVGQVQKDCPGGATFVGTEGSIHITRARLTAKPAEIAEKPLGDKDVRLYQSSNHHRNFLDCVRSRKLPICDVEIGHRSATACHLGNIALRLGRKIQWDPQKEQIVGDDEAARMLSRPYRAPWTL